MAPQPSEPGFLAHVTSVACFVCGIGGANLGSPSPIDRGNALLITANAGETSVGIPRAQLGRFLSRVLELAEKHGGYLHLVSPSLTTVYFSKHSFEALHTIQSACPAADGA